VSAGPYPTPPPSSRAHLTADLGSDVSSDDLLRLGIDQWQLESSALLDPSTGLYRHINDFDPYFWATGNGWMLHGGLRVLASIEQAGRADAFKTQIDDVRTTLGTVFTALFAQLDVSHTHRD
jgi:rhamnogalacturonyl hydrolase YesR